MVAALHNSSPPSCQDLGKFAEDRFVQLRRSHIIRVANDEENIHEHWDVLDDTFGRIDVKSAKRMHRGGEIDYTVWWELRTVARPPDNKPKAGWGIGNCIRRYIAVRLREGYYLLSPEEVTADLRWMKENGQLNAGRGEFLLHQRPDRGDLMTILPEAYVREAARHFVRDWL